jgi:hypothetical protein
MPKESRSDMCQANHNQASASASLEIPGKLLQTFKQAGVCYTATCILYLGSSIYLECLHKAKSPQSRTGLAEKILRRIGSHAHSETVERRWSANVGLLTVKHSIANPDARHYKRKS